MITDNWSFQNVIRAVRLECLPWSGSCKTYGSLTLKNAPPTSFTISVESSSLYDQCDGLGIRQQYTQRNHSRLYTDCWQQTWPDDCRLYRSINQVFSGNNLGPEHKQQKGEEEKPTGTYPKALPNRTVQFYTERLFHTERLRINSCSGETARYVIMHITPKKLSNCHFTNVHTVLYTLPIKHFALSYFNLE